MSAPKAHPEWGGRQRGTASKVTSSAREAIELAFEGLGGVATLTAWAKENQTDFFTRIWPKLLPLQISGDPENPLIPNSEPKPFSDNNREWLRKIIEDGRLKEEERRKQEREQWRQEWERERGIAPLPQAP